MYGDLGNKLAIEGKRSIALDFLPLYKSDLVSEITREITDINSDLELLLHEIQESQTDITHDRKAAGKIIILQLCMRRNKRCLLAYQSIRLNFLNLLAWQGTDITSDSGSTQAKGATQLEQNYFADYLEILAEYKGEWMEIDLTGFLEPPRDLFIDVRVLKDAGEIQTEYGVLNLTKNSQFYVRHTDVDRLIQQGILQKL